MARHRWRRIVGEESERWSNTKDCVQTTQHYHSKVTANLNIYPEDPVSMKTDHSEFQKVNIHERAAAAKSFITDTSD